ncbi:basic helix-loop-helix (bHLH) DNA-bindingsuperfamily protein [Striga asiatica]|uniref:Basic helix-loop-helix (BHLH) DNA-bindingsuperfamily protein n=1 Tax=Striga asiatica TaxID=4170 RepID=A0A5A7QL91_STRAF|nr:basic helix-loop-helix (bHLH) DNA-bindingsuperfamily protein [Striga asiatica]
MMEQLRESRPITTAGQKESSAVAEEEEEKAGELQFGRCQEEENIMFSRDDDTMSSLLQIPLDECPFNRDLMADLLYHSPEAEDGMKKNFGLISKISSDVTQKPEQPAATSSSGVTRGSGEAAPPPAQGVVAKDRKRKAIPQNKEDSECQSEDIGYKAPKAKNTASGSASSKRSRAAEVHNLSERTSLIRKFLIFLSMLQLDKASVLDETIEFTKSLMMQVQMLTMMLYHGTQGFVPYLSMPISPNMEPRFPMPLTNPSRAQTCNQAAKFPNFPNQLPMPSYADLYQQFLRMQQQQLHKEIIELTNLFCRIKSCHRLMTTSRVLVKKLIISIVVNYAEILADCQPSKVLQ